MSVAVRIGVVGLGYWGPNIVRNVDIHPEAELVAVCDSNPEALQRAAERYPHAKPYSSFAGMLSGSSPDGVIIASPTGLHFEHTIAALRAGKHVLVEKPMAGSAKRARELMSVAGESGLCLMVGHTFLYNNIVKEIKARLEDQELGDIFYAYSQRLSLGRFRGDSDVLWTLAPHDISIFNHWFEARPTRVSAHGLSHVWKAESVADTCFCLLEYPGGQSAHLHLSWLDPRKVRQIVLLGSKKMLVYDDVNPTGHIQIFDKGVERYSPDETPDYSDYKTFIRTGDLTVPYIYLIEPLAEEVSHFISCIRNNSHPLTDGWHGLVVTSVLEALSESMRRDGGMVAVDYQEQ